METHGLPVKQIFRGNLLLIVCCAFYLAWWILAFKPVGAVRGMKTGWLLIPAFASGLAAIILTVNGIQSASTDIALFPKGSLLWGAVAAYFILFAVTYLILKRPVTTELFLIVGWAALALSEINVLYGIGRFSHQLSLIFVVIIAAATLISLICYALYYNLGNYAGYFDGMVPLCMAALVMTGISVAATV